MSIKRKKLLNVTAGIILAVTLFSVFAFSALALFSKRNIDPTLDESLFLLAKGGSVTEYYYDDGSIQGAYSAALYKTSCSASDIKKWYSTDEIAKLLKDGFVAVEDKRFEQHGGVDVGRSLKALFNSVFKIRASFGASTITQQVIKNISGDNQLTVKRKLAEMIRAVKLEKNHSKDEILELYLNIVPMGENMVGVGAASERYFGKKPNQLTAAEAATLIGITNAPTRYNPHEYPEACLKKRNTVLAVMKNAGIIGENEYSEAINSDLNVLPLIKANEEIDSWFVETVNCDVIAALIETYGMSESMASSLVYGGGLKIYTTVDPEVQAILEDYFENSDNFPGKISEGLEFAMSVSDSESGDLTAIVGAAGKKGGNRLLNHAQSPHTPGSALKPIALYAPLVNSKRINCATVFDDVPISFTSSSGKIREFPNNYPSVYDGLTTVKDALKTSKNTVAVRLYNMLGAENIYRSLKNDFGIDSLIRNGSNANGEMITDIAPSPLALGQLSYGVSLRKLTEAYTVFAKEGALANGRSFVKVYDNSGRLLLDNKKEERQIYRKEAARIMNQLLSEVTENGTARAVKLKNLVDTAGKTGTSGDDKDRLFVGYTPYYTAGIWCGYKNGGEQIGKIAPTHIKIWDEIMLSVHKTKLAKLSDSQIKSFSVAGLKKAAYCKDSGELFSDNCRYDPRGVRMEYGYFEPSNMPKSACERHVLCLYDEISEGVATEACPEDYLKPISLLKISDRHFPKEIIISDADYVYMELDSETLPGDSYDVPYYINMIAPGDYVGRGRRKKQFNSYCYIHREE